MELHQTDVFLPAEWYPQSGLQLTWPHERTDWHPYLSEIKHTFEQLAEVVASHEPLIIVTPHCEETAAELKATVSQRAFNNIRFIHCTTHDTWARDHGPISLVGPTNVVCDFTFNGWGKKFPWKTDNAITRRLYKAGLFNAERFETDFVLEGGSIESDGRGTLFTTSTCLLAPNRNQPLSQQQIEQKLKEALHTERVVWLDHGNVVGDDTDGHIDTIVRTAPDDTLLYMRVEDESDPMFDDFKALEQQLQTLRTMAGKPYRLLPLPTPGPIYDDGERLPATYANFVIINGAVIVPTYQQPDLDQLAMSVVGKAFPDREIMGIDATVVIRQHGSLHCLTMQYPAGVLAKK
ncbi:MAG: agmatine deiminase family protein [Prevotella sp.]|jgi:agmatine/peptidylarginine deiminase